MGPTLNNSRRALEDTADRSLADQYLQLPVAFGSEEKAQEQEVEDLKNTNPDLVISISEKKIDFYQPNEEENPKFNTTTFFKKGHLKSKSPQRQNKLK